MKNIFLIAIVALFASSCTKTYDCVCTPKAGTTGLSTQTMQYGVASKSTAKTRCDEYRNTQSVNGFQYDCAIK